VTTVGSDGGASADGSECLQPVSPWVARRKRIMSIEGEIVPRSACFTRVPISLDVEHDFMGMPA
jgi:hypothetical protein